MSLREIKGTKKEQKIEKVRLDQEIDLKELGPIIFLKGELRTIELTSRCIN